MSDARTAGEGTTGLLMSDSVLIDPLLDETLWLGDGLGAWAYELDVTCDAYEQEAADQPA